MIDFDFDAFIANLYTELRNNGESDKQLGFGVDSKYWIDMRDRFYLTGVFPRTRKHNCYEPDILIFRDPDEDCYTIKMLACDFIDCHLTQNLPFNLSVVSGSFSGNCHVVTRLKVNNVLISKTAKIYGNIESDVWNFESSCDVYGSHIRDFSFSLDKNDNVHFHSCFFDGLLEFQKYGNLTSPAFTSSMDLVFFTDCIFDFDKNEECMMLMKHNVILNMIGNHTRSRFNLTSASNVNLSIRGFSKETRVDTNVTRIEQLPDETILCGDKITFTQKNSAGMGHFANGASAFQNYRDCLFRIHHVRIHGDIYFHNCEFSKLRDLDGRLNIDSKCRVVDSAYIYGKVVLFGKVLETDSEIDKSMCGIPNDYDLDDFKPIFERIVETAKFHRFLGIDEPMENIHNMVKTEYEEMHGIPHPRNQNNDNF